MDQYFSIVQQLKTEKDEMCSLLESWVNINSHSENHSGLAEMIDALSSAFVRLDGNIEKVPLHPQKKIDAKGNISYVNLGEALVISKHREAPIQVLLAGHMDTVFPVENPFQRLKTLDENRLSGPGAADMKGGLVVLLKALETLEKSSLAGKIGWEVLINADEEIGSPCSELLFREAAQRHRIGLLFEPSYPDGAIVNERKGSFNFTVTAKGKAAHAGRDFTEGRNAINAIARFICGVNSLTNAYQGITVNVGSVQGGGPVNIVPDYAACSVNIRITHPKDTHRIKASVQEMVDGLGGPNGISMSLHTQTVRPPKPFDAKNQQLYESLKTCAASLGIDLKWRPSGGVCDGNILSAAGLPTVDSLGVIGGGLHTPGEYLLADSLVQRSQLAAYFLMNIAMGKISV